MSAKEPGDRVFVLTHHSDLGPGAQPPSTFVDRGVRKVMGVGQRAGWRLTHPDGHVVGQTTDHWDYRDARDWASNEVKNIVGWTVRWVDKGDRWLAERVA